MKKKLKNVYFPPETKCNWVLLESTICAKSEEPVNQEDEKGIGFEIKDQEYAGDFTTTWD